VYLSIVAQIAENVKSFLSKNFADCVAQEKMLAFFSARYPHQFNTF